MMTRRIQAAVIGGLLALGAAAAAVAADTPTGPNHPTGKSKGQCFRTANIQGYAAADDDNIYIRVGVRDYYHLTMRGRCPNVEWNQGVAIVSHGSNWICTDRDADVITRAAGPQRCPIDRIEKMTPEQVAALPRRARP